MSHPKKARLSWILVLEMAELGPITLTQPVLVRIEALTSLLSIATVRTNISLSDRIRSKETIPVGSFEASFATLRRARSYDKLVLRQQLWPRRRLGGVGTRTSTRGIWLRLRRSVSLW